MSLLQQLTPLNLQEEKQKFFADHSYNPQFTYKEIVSHERLGQYPATTSELTSHAEEIVAAETKRDFDATIQLGRLLSQAEVTQKAEAFLKMHRLENKISIVWSASFVSRATITKDTLKLKSLAQFRERETAGMLFHEIGTHALRQVNYEQQFWYRKKKKNGFGSYLETEEGLATLHSLFPLENKSLYRSALRYLAVNTSQTHSFAQLWEFLTPHINDEEERWMVTLRQKRGLTDTAKQGVFTKDALYFSGAVKMAKWLQTHDFDLTDLYLGKLAAEDAAKAREMNPSFPPRLPSFFVADRTTYQENIEQIILYNNV